MWPRSQIPNENPLIMCNKENRNNHVSLNFTKFSSFFPPPHAIWQTWLSAFEAKFRFRIPQGNWKVFFWSVILHLHFTLSFNVMSSWFFRLSFTRTKSIMDCEGESTSTSSFQQVAEKWKMRRRLFCTLKIEMKKTKNKMKRENN